MSLCCGCVLEYDDRCGCVFTATHYILSQQDSYFMMSVMCSNPGSLLFKCWEVFISEWLEICIFYMKSSSVSSLCSLHSWQKCSSMGSHAFFVLACLKIQAVLTESGYCQGSVFTDISHPQGQCLKTTRFTCVLYLPGNVSGF